MDLIIASNSSLPIESVLAISMHSKFVSILNIAPNLDNLSHRIIECTTSSGACNLHAKLQNQLAAYNHLENTYG